jgi:hypothetical protein
MTPEQAIGIVIGAEGGFDADPRDRGNWTGGQIGVGRLNGTKFGISAATYPTLAIADLTLADAIGVYRLRYWVPAACDHLPDGLDLVVFDAAVNSGVAQSARWLQRFAGPQDLAPATFLQLTISRFQRSIQAARCWLTSFQSGRPTNLRMSGPFGIAAFVCASSTAFALTGGKLA